MLTMYTVSNRMQRENEAHYVPRTSARRIITISPIIIRIIINRTIASLKPPCFTGGSQMIALTLLV